MAEELENQENAEAVEAEEEPQFFYCDSCGKRLNKPEDRGGCKPDNTWCVDCCNPDGSHKSKEEIKKNIIKMIQGYDAQRVMGGDKIPSEEIDKMAEDYMKRMPAWGGNWRE